MNIKSSTSKAPGSTARYSERATRFYLQTKMKERNAMNGERTESPTLRINSRNVYLRYVGLPSQSARYIRLIEWMEISHGKKQIEEIL